MPSTRDGQDPPGHDGDDRSGRLLADLLKDSALSARWSVEDTSTRARPALAAGAVVPGLATTGILGLAGLLGNGEDVASWGLDGSRSGTWNAVLCLGVACLASVPISIHYSVRALKTTGMRIPARYEAFTDSGSLTGKITDPALEAWASLPKRAMCGSICGVRLAELRGLVMNIDTVSRHTMWGQALLPGGLLSGAAASMPALLAGP